MRPIAAVFALTLALPLAAAHAQEAECTTTTTTTTTCKGAAAPLAAPAPENAPPPVAYPSYPTTPQYAPLPPPVYQPQLQLQTRTVEEPRYGLMIAGASTFGAIYLINAAIAYGIDDGRLAIPVIGPLFYLESNDRAGNVFLVFDTIAQAAGVVMFIAGAVTHHTVTVFDNRVALLPTANSQGAGLAAVGHF